LHVIAEDVVVVVEDDEAPVATDDEVIVAIEAVTAAVAEAAVAIEEIAAIETMIDDVHEVAREEVPENRLQGEGRRHDPSLDLVRLHTTKRNRLAQIIKN